jgi:hypothetical protein
VRKVPGMLVFVFTAAVLLTTSLLGFAQGIGTVTQVGLENFVYVYQEVLSEVIILQLGDRNEASMEQFGAEHIAGLSQIGNENTMEIWQLGQRDLVLAVQGGAGNEGSISQMHSSAGTSSGGVSDNDAFTYQGGLFNRLNVLQVGDDNTTSIYQIDNNNEVFVVQEQFPLGAGRNAALIVQAGVNNWASALQLGAQQMLRSMQFGNDNSSTISQTGSGNRTSVLQDGSGNVFSAAQS